MDAINNDLLGLVGLTPEEGAVYASLLKSGSSSARKVATVSGVKRGMAYKALARLEALGLVEKHDPLSGVASFTPAHPSVLRDLFAKKQATLAALKDPLETTIGTLTSSYNLVSGRPNIRFFEGKKGMEEVLDDSLYAKEEIRTFADLESIMRFIPDINSTYVAKREKLGIKKRGIVYDTPKNREIIKDYHRSVTDIRFIPWATTPTETVVQIYDGKISYLTLRPDSMIGIIVEDPHIYTTHKTLFDFTWDQLRAGDATQQ